MEHKVRPGRYAPLGATFDGNGVNFAVFSENAKGMDLCLFDADGNETHTIPLREQTMHVWHGYMVGLGPGQRYGFRARGDYDPARGLLFNPKKLLVDPYARAVEGNVDYGEPVFAWDMFPAMSANPYLSFTMTAVASGELVFRWRDDKGASVEEKRRIEVA